MSRPAPTVLFTTKRSGRTLDICAAADLYAIYYNGSPINMRSAGIGCPRYYRTASNHPGYLAVTVRRLEALFGSGFTVEKLGVIKAPT